MSLLKGMYVRCPADYESITDPRVFICAQVVSVDRIGNTVTVRAYDPFSLLQFFPITEIGSQQFIIDSVDRCRLFVGTDVLYMAQVHKIIAVANGENGYYNYYIQDVRDYSVKKVPEADLVASFTNGEVDPNVQLANYEFQNPAWYFGRAVVSRSMSVLNNSVSGFRELAGSKIRLLPHQVNTVLRCLQSDPCRFLLADEVGMGKTIEALSILKIFNEHNAGKRSLIVVPSNLKEQWRVEMLLKFNIVAGKPHYRNVVELKSIDEITQRDLEGVRWSFVVVDEAHRYLGDERNYDLIHDLSLISENVLLLSATPVQQRREEYLELLRLLEPEKYDSFTSTQFEHLISIQNEIVQNTVLVLDDLEEYIEVIQQAVDDGEDPEESEDAEELFNDIYDELEEICDSLNDDKLSELLAQVEFGSADNGVGKIKVIISYICSSYQLESNIIRNRRRILELDEQSERLISKRELVEYTYDLDPGKNTYESFCYRFVMDLLDNDDGSLSFDGMVKPLLATLCSSPWAFYSLLESKKSGGTDVDESLMQNAKQWMREEDHIIKNVKSVLDDPFTYQDEYNTRLVTVLNTVYEEIYGHKVVLFTNNKMTFKAYREALSGLYKENEVSFFGVDMSSEELEEQAYAFQTDPRCKLMLCDYSGGEGRNFQCADYVLHIDLPWDANQIEQRIGRLDRLERDPERPVVTSVVVHSTDSFEAALFEFWSKGLKIFNQSLSGMEIIMKDINQEIEDAVKRDCRNGLIDAIPSITKTTEEMRATVRKEQNYDAAGAMFKPLYIELKRVIDYYAENENELFADAMTGWASLAGFKGVRSGESIVYSASSFSKASAYNSQLIPPKWDDYCESEQNSFVNSARESYGKKTGTANQQLAIRGTFERDIALKSDYLRFFAPGDAIFDCIVNNAMKSCKGRASAFSVPARINWLGLIYVWNLVPNETVLLDEGVSLYALAPYRGFLSSQQIITPIDMNNPNSISEAEIVREYCRIINSGFDKDHTKHFGKRNASYDNGTSPNSPISQFKRRYPEDRWSSFVRGSKKRAFESAIAVVSRQKTNIVRAKEEMERALSAYEAKVALYNEDAEPIESYRHDLQIVLKALREPRLMLDSVAYVYMGV